MRFVSPVALGLMLALGGMSLGVSAPSAIAKEKAPEGPKIKPSAGFMKAVQPFNSAVTKQDVEGAKAALPAAQAAATSNDDKFLFNQLLLNLSIAAKDPVMQQQALRGMIDTGLVPNEQLGQFATIAANNELTAKNYDAAIAYARKAEAIGYKPAEVYPILAQATWTKAGTDKAGISEGLQLFRKGIDAMKASGTAVPAQWYEIAVSKAAGANLPEVAEWARLAFESQPSGENLRTLLRVYQRNNPALTNRENLDLMRLMGASGGLAVKGDYLEYAEMAFKSGIFGEVKSVIDKGRVTRDRRSNLMLAASDGQDLYTVASQKIAADKATLATAERDAGRAATGKIAAATAEAYLGYGDYAKAAALYQLALQKGSVDTAEVNTRLGQALALAGNTAAAKEAFAKVSGGARGQIAQYWLAWLNGKPAA